MTIKNKRSYTSGKAARDLVKVALMASLLLGCSVAVATLTDEMKVCNEPAVILMKKYIDENLEKFVCDRNESEANFITTYSYDGVVISQHINRHIGDNLIYKLNGVVLEIDIGRCLFYHIQMQQEEAAQEKARQAADLNKHDSCCVIEDVLRSKQIEVGKGIK